ncbi:monofunctional biosynthetic peptidoglycan transglycosylase [Halotalea alkalilenta]|uniref:Biosynthetic peptidoglycan transglycosylase n=1 Tax=Halotalea alkalilenta TaxID=376489 RepID=A0A172YH23_9GAMM|nr:monofunctional biosynthetic peptidoglycan transglycosylase [Halotalea alkalilenta]ANF58493.1 monofunctional biosynthetic peptidoglycan transglycosylase [Halotalea alkalilenta]
MPRAIRRTRSSSLVARLGRWVVGLSAGFVMLSVLSVLLFRWLPVPVSSVMIERELQALSEGRAPGYDYRWVDYADISPQLKLAVIAAEDQRFPAHHGFDQQQIQQALSAWRSGGSLRGASTISQQTAKNLWLWSSSSWSRKAIEVWFTLLIEFLWPKQRILEVYLNLAEWDVGVFGAEAAARHYFGVGAAELGAGQAARLAAVLPAPRVWDPLRPNARVAQRIQWVERQMRQLGGVGYLQRLQ